MPKLALFLFIFSTLFATSLSATEMDLLAKLDDVTELVNDAKQRHEGKYEILNMMIKCEFDEQCELEMIPKLEALSKENHNLIYKGFLTYLTWEKGELQYNIKHCQNEEKRKVRKLFAECYQIWADKEHAIMNETRQQIDQFEHDRYMCIKEKMQEPANEGNIFAQAELVNVYEYVKDPKNLNLWSAKIESQKGTPQHDLLLRCPELP
jgi:hypothetical protein